MRKFAFEIKWGIIFTLCSLAWVAFEKNMGWHDELIAKHATNTLWFAIVAILVYVVALLDKKKNYYNGQMNWTQGFLSGLVITVIVAILSPWTQYIAFTHITPTFFDNMRAFVVENKTMKADAAANYFSMKNYMMYSVFGSLSMGVVTSAIVALFVRSKKTI